MTFYTFNEFVYVLMLVFFSQISKFENQLT